MSLKSCFLITVGAGMLFAATPSIASWPVNDPAEQSAAERCAKAAAAAQVNNNATEADLAKCTKAAALADLASDRAIALSNRSLLNFERADYNAAMADNTAAMQIDGRIGQVWVNRGAILLGTHHASDAAASFSRALTLAPAQDGYSGSDRAKIHFDLAMAREDMNDLKGAYIEYAVAAQMAPQWDLPKQQMARFSIASRKPTS